jgi:type VI secretion system secreted protein VgrG
LLEHESIYQTTEAIADTCGLGVGHKFTITNLHRLLQSDKPYIIVKGSYTVIGNAYESDAAKEQPEEYKATYTLIDAKTEYRTPRTTPKPVVQGPQTATVVGRKTGAADDELATDEHGRVMVKFHWDAGATSTGPRTSRGTRARSSPASSASPRPGPGPASAGCSSPASARR